MDNKEPQNSNNNTIKPCKSLGEILIRQGLITRTDLENVLAIQSKERKLQNLPIGQILVKLGELKSGEVDRILNHPEIREKIGRIAVQNMFLTEEELIECLKKKKKDQLLGQVFLEEGYIEAEELERLLEEQINSPRFGQLAVKLGLVSEEVIEKALKIQKSTRKLGEIICDLGLVDPLELNRCLIDSKKGGDIGDTLVDMGYITDNDLLRTKRDPEYSEKELGELLIRKRLITEVDLQTANSRHFNIPFETLEGFVYSPDEKHALSKIISKKFAETKLMIPISLVNSKLTIGLFRPKEELRVVYDLKNMYHQYEVSCVLITKEKYEELFEVLYSSHLGVILAPINGNIISSEMVDTDFMELNIDEDIVPHKARKQYLFQNRDLETEEIVNFIISYGISHGASDIHLEQSRKGVKLRYRFDGIMRETSIGWLRDKIEEKVSSIISRIKIMANLDIAEKRLPQDGSFRVDYYDKGKKERVDLDFRVATCRASVDENVTIRILDPRKANRGLESLNHSYHVLDPFKQFLKSPAGMILVVGPTGCGKTSTLYAALRYIDKPDIKIITAEDPIEYHFPTIMQTQINPKIDLSFSRLLRSFLRFDPDVIFVGEIRDEETARIGFDAAQTGHLILSTMHTNDSLGSITRLVDLGVEFGQISSSLMCVVSQRLVRKICPACIEEYKPEKDEWGVLFKSYPSHLRFYRGAGCEKCLFTGYEGRTLLSEIFTVTPEIALALNKGYYDETQFSKLALESGMKTMLDDGLMKLDQTTLSELIRMLPHDMIKKFRFRQQSQENVDLLIDDMLEEREKEEKASTETFVSQTSFEITNPETERSILDLILSRYEAVLKENGGNGARSVDSRLFKEFLTESFYKIYEKQPCRSITFNIQENRGTGKIKISAVPNR